MNKKIISILLTLIFLSVLHVFSEDTTKVSVNKNTDKQITKKTKKRIVVWAMGFEGKMIREIADVFEAENPDIKVVTQAIPWGAAHEKLITSVVGDMPPDISQLGTTWMSEFSAIGALEDLEPYVASSNVLKKEHFFEGAWNTNIYKNKVYGIPWYVDTRVLFYRKDLLANIGFNRPPATWKELKKACRALAKDIDGDGKIDKYGINLPTNDWNIITMFLNQNGVNLIDIEKLEPTINTPEAKETLKYYKNFLMKD